MSENSGGPRRAGLVIGQLTHGGTERQLFELATRLPARGIEPVIFCLSRADDPYGARLEQEGLTVRRLERRRRFEPRRVRLLARAFQEERVQLVHSFLFIGNAYAFFAARRARLRHFLPSVRSLEFHRGRLFRFVDRFVLSRARLVLVNSEYLGELVPSFYRVPAAKMRVVPNGLDLSRFDRISPPDAPRSTPAVIGSVSLFKTEKRIPFLLEMARLVLRDRPETRFRLIGDGPERPAMLRLRDELGLGEAVEMPGASDDVPGELGRFDVFVLVSEREGMPNAVLEAMAAARPVVASEVVGTSEVVRHGETGVLFPPDDPGAGAVSLLQLMDDPLRGRRMGEAGRRLARERYSAGSMVEGTVSVYRELMEGSA